MGRGGEANWEVENIQQILLIWICGDWRPAEFGESLSSQVASAAETWVTGRLHGPSDIVMYGYRDLEILGPRNIGT